ncbi:MAG: hypothetical protein MSS61_06250, partial [Bacteroidales bacterium]|nr:hypothetical protein [Bacteroidales bacterium]
MILQRGCTVNARTVQPLFLLHLRWESEISNFSSQISVFISEKVSDPRPRVTRPAPAGRVTCARGSRDLRARVADYVLMRRENAPAQTSFILRKVLDKEVYDIFEIFWVGCRTHSFPFLRLLCPFK